MGKAFLDPGFELLVNNWTAFRSPFFITRLLRRKCPFTAKLQAQALSACCYFHSFLIFQKTLHCTGKQRSRLLWNYQMLRSPQDSKPSVDNNTRRIFSRAINQRAYGRERLPLTQKLFLTNCSKNNSKWRACSQANITFASLPSLPLCFQPRSRPFVARAWMRKDYGLFCSLKDRSTDRQTWRTLKRIAIVVRKLVSLTIFQRSFLLIDAMLQRHILFRFVILK